MKLKHTLLLLILSVTSYNLFAQSADDIINDYLTAIGGRDKIGQINSVYMEGTFDVMGNTGTTSITILNGKGYKGVTDVGGQQVIQVITDTSGWMVNPFMGSSEPTPIPHEQYIASKDQIYIGGALLNYKEQGYNVQFTGMEDVDGKPAYKLDVAKDSISTIYYIDSATHFLTQLIRTYNGQTTTVKYSDFKETDFGNIMPHSQEVTIPQGMQLTYTITKVETNKPVDPSIFDMPKN
jgi:outer membrane lipoprotein-sorting protein